MRKITIITLIIIFLNGILWYLIPKIGLGRFPGDIFIKKGNFNLYLPITTSIIISVVISIIIWIAKKL